MKINLDYNEFSAKRIKPIGGGTTNNHRAEMWRKRVLGSAGDVAKTCIGE
jgi:hypothetical protein